MARLDALTIAVDCPDVSPADFDTLDEAAEAVGFNPDLSARLIAFRDRVARMLLTADVRPAAPEDR